ncbi:serine hydrolase domain-containing protein [Coraliomargarita algicola]|uniref:Serine hydrolase domain-containing protein n=1 Tax=Coraliomargarita algicola TaxID=3092156 RepID=A0ABZ0RPI1_9BACT|nr:serine hydrolase domain-containing protein [Coraliomargarita sp. J2-16]WPJ96880.1 serine hydrolase domain-containing protein [Coraliomargarita sp. J2-16]
MNHNLQEKVQSVLDAAVERGTECGCQAALYINGELAVNAYAGHTDWTQSREIDANTIFPVYSTGKAPSSTVLHRLVEQGLVDYDTYIADIWPGFGCHGKEALQVWHVLSYRAGLYEMPELDFPEQAADWEYMLGRMAQAKPAHAAGAHQEYHPATYGWLAGGIACHLLDEMDYFKIFREQVGELAGMDRFYYGADDAALENAAKLVSARDGSNYGQGVIDRMNNPIFRKSCNPAYCTMSNALSIAKHYAAIDSGRLLTPETLDYALKPWCEDDYRNRIAGGRWVLFGLGYVLSGRLEKIGSVFGHGGVGGSEGLLDTDKHYAMAITRNLYANPNVMGDFYAAIGFKNRDWPDTAEIPKGI